MKFLLDENLSASFASMLKKKGYEARHVSEVGLESTEDDDIVSFAKDSGEIIVTYDLDFSRIISSLTLQSPSLITLRVTKLNGNIFLRIFQEVISTCRSDLEKGAMITVDDDRIRVRKLPVIKKKK